MEQTQPVLTDSLHMPQPLGSDEAGATVPCHSVHAHRPEICCAAHGEKGHSVLNWKRKQGSWGRRRHWTRPPSSHPSAVWSLSSCSDQVKPHLLRKGTCFLHMKQPDPPRSSTLITHLCNTCYWKYFFSFLVYFLLTFPLVHKFYEKRDFFFFSPL